MKKITITKDVTPLAHRNKCLPLPMCPAVFETAQSECVIIGRLLSDDEIPDEVKKRIGPGEKAIIVPKTLLVPDAI